jgi:phosphogluconate dehydratase
MTICRHNCRMASGVKARVAEVTARITDRSRGSRAAYLRRIDAARTDGPARLGLGCSNFAHGLAACGDDERLALAEGRGPAVAIVTSYNDMLSAHQPFATYPRALRQAVMKAGGTAQVAGGVPAMCDGITQGRPGMELSLFSREVVAMATAIALSHEAFDAALLLGVCDKIVPGLLIGALSFGHLPALLVPAGPMPSGLPNTEKSRVRQRHAEGAVEREELLAAESASYHAPGTCTFYGTANTNQLVVEAMGLQLPGSSFVNPGTELRTALTAAAARRAVELSAPGPDHTPLAAIVDERALVNAIVALLATGGSTNHTMHLVAIAAAAGIDLRWEDFDELSAQVPLLARIYPNGEGDVNGFQAAGGTAFLFGELLEAGLLHPDVLTVAGPGLERYTREPRLAEDGRLADAEAPARSGDPVVLRGALEPFAADGGLRLLRGNLGRAVIKVSALGSEQRSVTAPARIFEDQGELLGAFDAGELDADMVAVVRGQGPRANGMPELHKLTTPLGVLQDRGRRVAIVTDGRMSGASGKVPAAIHCTPEAASGGPLGLLRDGDLICLDAEAGALEVLDVDLAAREHTRGALEQRAPVAGVGRELFAGFRDSVGPADRGASIFSMFSLEPESMRT